MISIFLQILWLNFELLGTLSSNKYINSSSGKSFGQLFVVLILIVGIGYKKFVEMGSTK